MSKPTHRIYKTRRLIWDSYAQGTYIRSLHGPIGAPKHVPNRERRLMERQKANAQ